MGTNMYNGRNKRRNREKNNRVNFSAFFVIMIIAVLAGYMTTRFVLYPILNESADDSISGSGQDAAAAQNLDPAKNQPTSGESGISVVEDGIDDASAVSTNTATSGYAVQFGSFTTKLAAETLKEQLAASGIKAEIAEKDGAFKVIGQLFRTKEEASGVLSNIDKTLYTDTFIASF